MKITLSPVIACALMACSPADLKEADSDVGPADGIDSGTANGGSQPVGSDCPTFACQPDIQLSGEIDGTGMPSDDRAVDSVWFNQSLDEIVLSPVDEAAMNEMGLDPAQQADVERYRYLVTQADYRFLAAETAEPDPESWFEILPRRKDITIFFFDLTGHQADADHPVQIFDLTPIERARDSGDRNLLGDAVRAAADAIRDNGHPDVAVAYAADRSEEGSGNILISLLSRTARYASGGQAWIFNVTPVCAEPIKVVEPPLPPLETVSVRAQPTFPTDEDSMSLVARCLSVTMSGQ